MERWSRLDRSPYCGERAGWGKRVGERLIKKGG